MLHLSRTTPSKSKCMHCEANEQELCYVCGSWPRKREDRSSSIACVSTCERLSALEAQREERDFSTHLSNDIVDATRVMALAHRALPPSFRLAQYHLVAYAGRQERQCHRLPARRVYKEDNVSDDMIRSSATEVASSSRTGRSLASGTQRGTRIRRRRARSPSASHTPPKQ